MSKRLRSTTMRLWSECLSSNPVACRNLALAWSHACTWQRRKIMDDMKLATIGMCLGWPIFLRNSWGKFGDMLGKSSKCWRIVGQILQIMGTPWGDVGNWGKVWLDDPTESSKMLPLGNCVKSQPTSQFWLELTQLPTSCNTVGIYIVQWEHGMIEVWIVLVQDVPVMKAGYPWESWKNNPDLWNWFKRGGFLCISPNEHIQYSTVLNWGLWRLAWGLFW